MGFWQRKIGWPGRRVRRRFHRRASGTESLRWRFWALPTILDGALMSLGASAPSTTVRSLRELQWSPSPAVAGADDLRRFPFQVGFPLAQRGEAVHHGAVVEGALCCRHVFGF